MLNSPDKSNWPTLPFSEFKSTAHLIHMITQMMGKLKLTNPFEPHWGNVSLTLSAHGLTSGPIFYKSGFFTIDLDIFQHLVICKTSWGLQDQFAIKAMSVAECYEKFFTLLKKLKVELTINTKPQEIQNPIPFEKDTQPCEYKEDLVMAWWEILVNTYGVFQLYHSRFDGESPPVALMWGTFDLRDVRYNGTKVKPTGINAGYIRRKAMDEAQIECGWWPGNELYPQAAYYSFTYPQPADIENSKIKPDAARWDKNFGEFLLDYDELRKSVEPASDLLAFLESTYAVGAELAEWDPTF